MHSAVEQTKYWMWTRREFSGRPFGITATGSSYDSWEEQAFAEDSAGLLGGCVWPPRSYSCSFCQREFRSAQALGGHMNIHRRDRARLKQFPEATSENLYDEDHKLQLDHLYGTQRLAAQYVPDHQLSTAVHNPNPSSDKNHGVAASPLSPSRVSSVINSRETCDDDTLIPPTPTYSSSIIPEGAQQYRKESPLSSTTKSLIDLVDIREVTVVELKLGRENWRHMREVGCRRERDTGEDDEEIPNKKRRTDPMVLFSATPASANPVLLQSEVVKFGPDPVEELDLELRLGDRPKVQ